MLRWKNKSQGTTVLMIEGARRVGKSYIAEEFARNEYDSYIMIDFLEENDDFKARFNELRSDLDSLFLFLQAYYSTRLIERRSVIILDEIQKFPPAREMLKYLVNDLLMNLYGLAPLCIPINKTGNQNRQFPAMVEAGFKSENHIIMFPAGLCSRKQNGIIRDLPWAKTFITKSVETKRDVVPIHFGGYNSEFFYRLANISKSLGIKFNIAMIFLVDEMFKNCNKTFTVKIGKPIPWQTFDRSKSPAEWAAFVQDIVYKL